MNTIALDRLKAQLLITGIQKKEPALYQVIDQLITYVRQLINETETALEAITGGNGNSLTQTFTTIDNELATLPNSKQLIPGTGIQFMETPSKLLISGVMMPGADGQDGEEGPMGMIGPQGPRGIAGSGGANSMPYWFPDEESAPETFPLVTLNNSTEVIPGLWRFTNGTTVFENNTPQIQLKEIDAALDEKYWRFISSGGSFFFQLTNDALTVGANVMEFQRSGAVMANIVYYTNGLGRTVLNANGLFTHIYGFALSGVSSVALVADQTAWNPTGLGTAFLISVTPTGAYNIRGMTAAAGGVFVSIYNTTANTMSIFHEDGAAAAANRFNLPNGVGFGILQFQTATFMYNSISSRWIVISKGD